MAVRQDACPFRTLPAWTHPEYGVYQPVSGPPPQDDFEWLYWDMVTALILRKWPSGAPEPRMWFARMWHPGEIGSWGPVPCVIVDTAGPLEKAWDKASATFLANMLCTRKNKGFAYASPFFEWELAEFWEGGYYDR